MKDVCVIVPTYNCGFERLKRTVDSIINQKCDNFELIISDDCSKNGSIDIIEKYLSNTNFLNYIIVRNIKNEGTVCNIRKALALTNANYIKLLGQGDMFYDDGSLQSMLKYAKESNCDLLIHDYKCFDARTSGMVTISKNAFPRNPNVYNRNDVTIKIRNKILYSDLVCGVSTLYKRDPLYESICTIATKVKYTEDFAINLLLLKKCKTTYIKECLVLYEYGLGMSTSKESNNRLVDDMLNGYQLLIDNISDNSIINHRVVKRLSYILEHHSSPSLTKTVLYYLFNLDVFCVRAMNIAFPRKTKR